MSGTARIQAVVIGGGPAGLMAAEALLGAGLSVDLYEAAASVGRKILIAGKGGLNLTHSEPRERFIERYRERSLDVARWLEDFDAGALRAWARGLGIETVVGSSGRVFPRDFKAAPLLRGWLRRLRAQGLQLHTRHRFVGWDEARRLRIEPQTGSAELRLRPTVSVLALGGASWSKLGADGRWVEMLRAVDVDVAELKPANCGFECDWSPHLRARHGGEPVKQVTLRLLAAAGAAPPAPVRGEFVLTDYGIEGSLVYALSAALREAIERAGCVSVAIDLCPDRSLGELQQRLATDRRGRSWSEHLRRQVGLGGVRYALLRELAPAAAWLSAAEIAQQCKQLMLVLQRTRPIDEAISSAGGVRFAALDRSGMLLQRPGVWCAGEMLDWEAPTGGYLLTACLASGLAAGRAAAQWATRHGRAAADPG